MPPQKRLSWHPRPGLSAEVGAIVFLQAVPFLLFTQLLAPGPREQAMLHGALVFHAVTLVVFLLLLPRRRTAS